MATTGSRQDQRHRPGPSTTAESLPGIHHLIAVASGKGGVGKSTVAVNLALALKNNDARIGLVDADILGPSIPGMLGLHTGQPPAMTPDGKIFPVECLGLKTISMGLLTSDDAPAVLRGPMVSKYLRMLIANVQWGKLDYLILDLPPGTGDTQLTLAQSFPLSGAVIITTPQDVSLKIARRGLRMFEKVNVPILGIIENMSTFICPHCGKGTDVFSHGGGERMSRELGVPFLGAIPLDAEIVTGGDTGHPILLSQPDSIAARAFLAIAEELVSQLQGHPSTALKPYNWNWETGEGQPLWVEAASHPEGSPTTAVGIQSRDERTISILWEDGQRQEFDVRDLRLACRCALCIEEMSGRALLDPKTVGYDVTPRTISSVGNYAFTVNWSDGHSTGIYSFTALRELGERSSAGDIEDV